MVRSPQDDGIVSLHQLEPVAREVLDPAVWDYVEGGAGDEHTLRWNVERWSSVRLAPRVLRDVSRLDTSTTLMGTPLPHPILLAPTATHGRYHPGAERATLDGARAAGSLPCVSTLSSLVLDDVAAHARSIGSPWWLQVYVQSDRGHTEEFVRRAVDGGATALALTVDTPTLGARDRDRRDASGTAHGATYANLPPAAEDGTPRHRRVYNPHLASDVTWSDLAWLAELAGVPVLVKGVLRPDDAARAVEHGAAGVIVSNHGARNLDTVPATVDALPTVVHAVAGRVPVLVDGGIRRGTDVAKALCLGASAVLVGRPYVWGLAAYGADGVRHVVELLRTELEMAMALLGAPALPDLTTDLIWPAGPAAT